MKKFSLLIISLLTVAAANATEIGDDGFGQRPLKKTTTTTETTSSKKDSNSGFGRNRKVYGYEVSVGVRAGIGFSSMSESDGLEFSDGMGVGFGGGVAANIRFGNKDSQGRPIYGQGLFGVGLELNFKQHAIKTLADEDLKLSNIEVPLMLQFYPGYKMRSLRNLYIEVGPSFTIPMSASPDAIQVGKQIYPVGDFKAYDVKLAAGVGYRFSKGSANDGFYANLRYYLGTSKLAGNFPAKVGSAELSIGYLFKCVGGKK